MTAESPRRPRRLPVTPPVDVAAARRPAVSRATAPTVSPPGARRSRHRRRASSVMRASGAHVVRAPAAAVLLAAYYALLAHRARLERIAGHDGRVHLDDPLDGQYGAEARVEQRIVLEHGDRGDHGVERVSARAEHGPPRLDGARHAVPARGAVGRRFGSRAPVHGDHRHGASTRAGIARL